MNSKNEYYCQRKPKINAFAKVGFGQFILGAGTQILIIVLAKHSLALSILAGWLMGFGAFGVMLKAAWDGESTLKASNLVLPILVFIFAMTISITMYFVLP